MKINMRNTVKGFKINPLVSKEILIKAGFNQINENIFSYFKIFHREKVGYDDFATSFNIKINLDKEFNIVEDVDVLDEAFLQPHIGFYQSAKVKTKYVDEIIDGFNKTIDNLIEKNVLMPTNQSYQELIENM